MLKSKRNIIKYSVVSVLALLFIFLLNIIVSNVTGYNFISSTTKSFLSGLGIYTEEVRNVEIMSNDYSNPGSWKINKSAEWIGKNDVRVTLDLKSIADAYNEDKDIVLILDTSESMFGDKLDEIKRDSLGLLNTLLSNNNNRIALVTFNSISQIVTNFTNDEEILKSGIQSISASGGTNYNAALLNLDSILDDYTKVDGKDLIVMFLTDGLPEIENPNQIATYNMLKDKYPYLIISGVQYEMGSTLNKEIKKITDRQWIANTSNINNVLLEILVASKIYDKFEVTDYIGEDFNLESISNVNVTNGNVYLSNEGLLQKVEWRISSYMSGQEAKMTIDIKLKDEYQGVEGYYLTNDKVKVDYKLPDSTEKTLTNNKTPILKNKYKVTYSTNTPDGCTLPSIDSEKYFVFTNVDLIDEKLSCDGYLFKGWEISDDNIKRVNSDVYIMPQQDITIRGIWTKQAITKSMDGIVNENTTLYKAIEDEATIGTYVKKYTGEHKDSYDGHGTDNIYYYTGNVIDKNNVIFAEHCWQILRTTDTGGVKMIYNGDPDTDGTCLNTRSYSTGIYSDTVGDPLAGDYAYADSYVYDANTKTFKLVNAYIDNYSTNKDLIGKYTCMNSDIDATCTVLYSLLKHNENRWPTLSRYYIGKINYAQMGQSSFNHSLDYSPTYVGYMYGDVYNHNSTKSKILEYYPTSEQTMLGYSSLSTSYYYADSIDYGNNVSNRYTLNNPYKVTSTDDYQNLVGKYTFLNTKDSYNRTSVYYIVYVNGTTAYYKQLSNGELISKFDSIVFGDNIVDNEDGTYTITDTIEPITLTEWYKNYNNYLRKYTCNNNSTTCEDPRYVTKVSRSPYEYYYVYIPVSSKILIAKNRNGLQLSDYKIIRYDDLIKNRSDYASSGYKYTCGTTNNVCTENTLRMIISFYQDSYLYAPNRYFGASARWDGSKYILEDVKELESTTNLDDISTHHYICEEVGKKECQSVGYIYYSADVYANYQSYFDTFHYILLENGIGSINDVLDAMFKKNTNDSTIKKFIDNWYKSYFINYKDYLEDTIFCNDRSSPASGEYTFEKIGWNQNGGRTDKYLYFGNSSDLSCTNEEDQFSINNPKAKLTYPIGLASLSEMNLINNTTARKTGDKYYWLMSPYYYNHAFAYESSVNQYGDFSNNIVSYNYRDSGGHTRHSGVRPVISLKPDIEYSSGDGSMRNPYIVDTEE